MVGHVTIPVRGIDASAGVTVGVWNIPRTEVTWLDGVSIHSSEAIPIALQLPQRCTPGTVDRLDVRVHVGDRELRQTVRLDARLELCP